MLYTLRGKVTGTGDGFIVLECQGVGYRVFVNDRTLASLAGASAGEVTLFVSLFVRNDRMEVYGFLEEGALKLFEILNTVAGVGPKTALGILDIDAVPNVIAAILEKRVELLTRAPGIGKKTAERVILELQNRVKLAGSATLASKMDLNAEVEEVLVGLGYSRAEVRKVLERLPHGSGPIEEHIRTALKTLGTRH